MGFPSSIGLAIPAGLNAYIPLLAVAVANYFGWLTLRAPFDLLGSVGHRHHRGRAWMYAVRRRKRVTAGVA